jgi:hypothetical protein
MSRVRRRLLTYDILTAVNCRYFPSSLLRRETKKEGRTSKGRNTLRQTMRILVMLTAEGQVETLPGWRAAPARLVRRDSPVLVPLPLAPAGGHFYSRQTPTTASSSEIIRTKVSDLSYVKFVQYTRFITKSRKLFSQIIR